jgi:hypothetical protein
MLLSEAMEAKMLEFKDIIIMHPQYENAIDTMLHGVEATRLRNEPCSALLLGDSGTGKSTACAQLIHIVGEKRVVFLESGSFKQVPAFDCKVPATYSINDLCTEMLKQLETNPPQFKLATLQTHLFRLLITCATKVIIIDEVHDLLNPSAERTWRNVCKWIKYVANSTGIAIILSGKPATEILIDKHEELAGRFPYRARLSNLKYDNTFKSVLNNLNIEMTRIGEFKTPLHITDSQISGAFYLHTRGNMRSLRILLYEIMHSALSRNNQEVTSVDCIAAASRLNKKCPTLHYTNSFELTNRLLNKQLEQLTNA